MLNSLLLAIRFLILVFSGHKQVALENIALRHQLAVFAREKKRPRLRDRDRLFWIALKTLYKDWRAAFAFVSAGDDDRMPASEIQAVLVEAEKGRMTATVFGVRKLVRTMVAANPIWEAPRIHEELLRPGFEIPSGRFRD